MSASSHILCVNRTAALHPIEDVMTSAFQGAHGGEFAAILHDIHCHVMDASHAMQAGHTADAAEGEE